MKKIPFAVGQAAETAVMSVDADSTLTNSSGGASVFAGLVISRRGQPGKVLKVSSANYETVLGEPIHPRTGSAFEPFRHVERATKGGTGGVVRVCAPDMKIPGIALSVGAIAADPVDDAAVESIKLSASEIGIAEGEIVEVILDEDDGEAVDALQASEVTFAPNTTPVLPEGASILIYIKDGDASANRFISTEVEEDSDLFTIFLFESSTDGSVTLLESHQASLNVDARTDMGEYAWLPTILDNGSTRLAALVSNNAEEELGSIAFELKETYFTGGSDGDFSMITAKEYLDALKVLENSPFSFTALLSLGCYDPTVLAALNSLAEDVRVDMFYDLKGNQLAEKAMEDAQSHGLSGSHQPCRYYFPYSCRDTATSMNVVFGISCDAFVAKAKGVALVSDVGGWHYSPAGASRGVISRQNITPIANLDTIDREAFVKARINPVTVDSNGNVIIDDALTTYGKQNYLRFQHVSSLMNAIARGFYEIAEAVKHEPDGVTRKSLTDGMTDLLDRFFAADALVTPRDTSQGTEPYVLTVKKLEIDLWQVEWAVCPTGSARRIVGKPILMR
jgi:hypothetical protein